MKEDRYEFDFREWEWELKRGITDTLTVTRKKPKVRVEWKKVFFGDLCVQGYGNIYIVQFRVTGWDGKYVEEYTHYSIDNSGIIAMKLAGDHTISAFNMGMCAISTHFFYIGSDARDKWSAPVLLPESIYSKLDDICRALEQKANEVKG